MTTPAQPPVPPPSLHDLLHAMHALRDDLLKVSLLLRDHLYEVDEAGREQARQAAEALIRRQSGSGASPSRPAPPPPTR
jgi:hypothetical protein